MNEGSNLRLSIIIPVYNLEGYIGDTLDSCLNQGLKESDYEIICVNDGSKDNSLNILYNYARKYSNIKVYDKKNGGVSQTRNFGLSKATGKYVWFVDGDDLITAHSIQRILEIAETEKADIIGFKMMHFNKEPKYVRCAYKYQTCHDREELYKFTFSIGEGGVCVNLYKLSIINDNNLRFNERMKYSEDVLFHFSVLLYTNVFVKTKAIVYNYRQRVGSAMHTSNPVKFAESMELLAYEYNDLLNYQNDSQWIKITIDNRDRAVRALLFSLVTSGQYDKTKSILKQFSSLGFYPYNFRPKSLYKNKSFKQFLINLLSFPFPIRSYTLFVAKCFEKLRK